MYTNPSNIIRTIVCILERNQQTINQVIQRFIPNTTLTVFEGKRPTLPVEFYPSLEIEPGSGNNQWATTRAQRPRYNFDMYLTVKVTNMDFGVEYITTVTTTLVEILTDPTNLQPLILYESRWSPNAGLVPTVATDSFVEDVTYASEQEGTIRVAQWPWWTLIHEPYPESKFRVSVPEATISMPTIILPKVITVP